MDPSSPTQMEQGYNTRLPPSTSSLSSPERSEGSGLPGLGARQAAQNLSSCQGQQQQQQQQAMQQGQCPQAAAPSLVESQFLSCAPGLAQWPSMTAVPPSVTGQCSQGSQNGPHGCCGTMGNAVCRFLSTRMFSETRVPSNECDSRTRLFTFWEFTADQFGTPVESTTGRKYVSWSRTERCCECRFELRQCPSVAFGSSFRFKLPVAEHTCCRGEYW